MLLTLGTCKTEDLLQTLHTIEVLGFKESVRVVDSLTSSNFIRGRYPAFQCEDGELVIYGTQPICQYLKLKHTEKRMKGIESPELHAKYGNHRDGRSVSSVLSIAFKDAISRAFPHCFNESLIIEVKADGRTFKGVSIDYSFSRSQQLLNEYKSKIDINNPQDMAKQIASYLDLDGLNWLIKSIDLTGFYINITISDEFVSNRIDMYSTCNKSMKIPVPPLLKPEIIVVDFSSPNIAKEMHVGHLRSTIIGDSLCKLYEHFDHTVYRVNHVGDWGTQFGMLLEYLKDREVSTKEETNQFLNSLKLGDLTKLYQDAKKAFDADQNDFKNRARLMVVGLQSGKDLWARQVWSKLVDISKIGFESIYSRLNVSFPNESSIAGIGYCGESFYQDKIEETIKLLDKLVVKRGDALLLFTGLKEAKQEPSEEHPDGEIPLFLKKSDGGFGYDSTDMAAIRYRVQNLKADRILYVTDSGQSVHFHMIFAAAKLAGWLNHTKADHVPFGVVTAKGGGRLRTREGDVITLDYLLNAAKHRMKEILVERMKSDKTTTQQWDAGHIELLSSAIGYAAVKYFDLRTNRVKDYAFDEEAMCSPDGDTAVYLMYAYARVCSIIDKGNEASIVNEIGYKLEGASDRERKVAMLLNSFNEVLEKAMETLQPNPICGYLYSLASELSTLLTDDNERVWAKRPADSAEALKLEPQRGLYRLLLVRAARSVLFQGLQLLGITPFDRM